MKLNYFFCLTVILIWSITAFSQTDSNNRLDGTIQINFAQQVVIDSKEMGEERTINIYLPDSFYKSSDHHTYPVLLLLEDEFFLMVSGVVKHLSSVERMPETIVVSLVDGPQAPKLYTNGSDFWPEDWKQLPFGGDSKPFSNHLEKELFPHLKQKFRANDFRMILGFSGSSTYTLHTLVKEPELFDAHIAIASGDILGMGYDEGESFINLIVNDFKRNPERKGFLYITSADSDAEPNSPMIKTNLAEFERRLSPYRSNNFKFVSKIFPNEGHYDVALPALSEAFELIFPKDKWSAQYNEIISAPGNAMENIDSYFQNLSKEYDFEILPKTERWNSGNSLSRIGPRLLRQGKPVEAVEIIERWVLYSPKSTLALSELSKAYEASNEIKKAISILEKAQQMNSELYIKKSKMFQTQINRLKDKLLLKETSGSRTK